LSSDNRLVMKSTLHPIAEVYTTIQLFDIYQGAQGQWRTEGGLGCSNPPPLKFWRPSKIVPNSTRLWKLLKICWI